MQRVSRGELKHERAWRTLPGLETSRVASLPQPAVYLVKMLRLLTTLVLPLVASGFAPALVRHARLVGRPTRPPATALTAVIDESLPWTPYEPVLQDEITSVVYFDCTEEKEFESGGKKVKQ